MAAKTQANKPTKIPHFKTYQDEAEFWDHHSPEDFPNDFEEVDVEFVSSLARSNADKDERTRLLAALAGLSDEERQAFTLVLLGLSASEVAKVMNWDAARCQRHMRRARERLAGLEHGR
jgi:DNA-directed RNA polymerase specialized sigma24 family protein